MVSADGSYEYEYLGFESVLWTFFFHFIFFLAHQSGARARAKARAKARGHQLFIDIAHVRTQLETTRL